MGIHDCDGHLTSIYRIDWTATERIWPAPMIAVSSSNQTIGVILVFIRHPLIGFIFRHTDMHTVYNKRGKKASGITLELPNLHRSPRKGCFNNSLFVGVGTNAGEGTPRRLPVIPLWNPLEDLP
jgi:hypothetical protein